MCRLFGDTVNRTLYKFRVGRGLLSCAVIHELLNTTVTYSLFITVICAVSVFQFMVRI